jgi:hypothetical protein
MKTARQLSSLCCALSLTFLLTNSTRANEIGVSFWGYDEAGKNTPYYSHYQILSSLTIPGPVAEINLLDAGWQCPTVETKINGSPASAALRSVGWHEYNFTFNSSLGSMSLSRDGNLLQSSAFTGDPRFFQFLYHNVTGNAYSSAIDDLTLKVNGTTVFQDNFDSPSIGANWIISRLDAGTYIYSGVPSLTHSGTGALTIGQVGGGNVAAGIALDLTAIVESGNGAHSTPDTISTFVLTVFGFASLVLLRSRFVA